MHSKTNYDTMQTNPAVEENKDAKWSESPLNQSGMWGKDGKDLSKSQVLSL